MALKFETNLPHQNRAVEGVFQAFADLGVSHAMQGTQNPLLQIQGQEALLQRNLEALRRERGFQQAYTLDAKQRVFDISMETGTGKTYAYTKTMLSLHRQMGMAKFIVAVPRLAIKAGTVSFLKAAATREHFRDLFDCDIKVHEVHSQPTSKNKKQHMPQAIADFCRADVAMHTRTIHVLVINAGMINSKTLEKTFDQSLFDTIKQPLAAIANTKPVLIVDEPHLFRRGNSTYQKMMRFAPQFTLRYGATFDGDLINLVNELTAVEAFNEDLVKGIIAHVERFEAGQEASLKLTQLTGSEAQFVLKDGGKTATKYSLSKGDSFAAIHPQMQDLFVSAMNKRKLVLSNGLELAKGAVINPYSYADSLSNKMMANAIKVHFDTERELFIASPRIKPLTLFFIDNIDSYRDQDGVMRTQFEAMVKGHIEGLIAAEANSAYKAHLTAALADIGALHGGYFAKDNSDKEEAIEQETLEILHQKETLLAFDNPRRFVFSKWTLREGWDNPNVFTICKLRSSGSDTSKLQEVGRGLRLPVNEYLSRDKSKTYFLNYLVDFTEHDFVEQLVAEINSKSQASFDTEKLTEILINRLLKAYSRFNNDEDALLQALDRDGIIKRNNDFTEGGYEKLKTDYPAAFSAGINKNKVKNKASSHTTRLRKGKYSELKALWEQLNRKVVLEYDFSDDQALANLFYGYLQDHFLDYQKTGSRTEVIKLTNTGPLAHEQRVASYQSNFTAISVMSYTRFLVTLSTKLALSLATLHNAFVKIKEHHNFNIDNYLSHATVAHMQKGFNDYLMQHVFGKFNVGYRETSNAIHPTALTYVDGLPKDTINSGSVGTQRQAGTAIDKYLFEEIDYDGQLELDNIGTDISEVIVFSKIPKNSIRIPLVGGGSYSPDFAYVLKSHDGQSQLSLVVETKGKDDIDLSELEQQKIKHAEQFFNRTGQNVNTGNVTIRFEKQLKNKTIQSIIEATLPHDNGTY